MRPLLLCFGALIFLEIPTATADVKEVKSPKASNSALVERGRYLVEQSCNDCHTSNWANSGGAEPPEAEWLTGDSIGWKGPWGTTYPINLRLFFKNLNEQQWLAYARVMKTRPPMPWYAVNRMTEEDLRALYAYMQHLGPKGNPAPTALLPGELPTGAYFSLVLPEAGAQAK